MGEDIIHWRKQSHNENKSKCAIISSALDYPFYHSSLKPFLSCVSNELISATIGVILRGMRDSN